MIEPVGIKMFQHTIKMLKLADILRTGNMKVRQVCNLYFFSNQFFMFAVFYAKTLNCAMFYSSRTDRKSKEYRYCLLFNLLLQSIHHP